MATIERIGETKQGRFALFTEEGFLFSVDAETLLRYDLQEGSSLNDEELSSLKEQSDTRKAKDKALRLLSRRSHGAKELQEKLSRHFDEDTAFAAVAHLMDLGLLDDAEFAAQRAEALAEKGKSGFDICHRLVAQGIDRELALQTAEALGLDEAQMALELVRRQYGQQLKKGRRQSVMAALARRGFSHGDIQYAVQAAEEEQGEE